MTPTKSYRHREGKVKVWRRKESAHDPNDTSQNVKCSGGGVMNWACMAAARPDSLFFIDDITHDSSCKI